VIVLKVLLPKVGVISIVVFFFNHFSNQTGQVAAIAAISLVNFHKLVVKASGSNHNIS
jgi:hypothetical protein